MSDTAMKSACGEYECPCHDELIVVRADLAAANSQLRTILGTAAHVKLVKLADGIDGLDARLCDAMIRWHDEFCELQDKLAAANIWIGTCKNHDPYTAAWTTWKLRAEKAEADLAAAKQETERLLSECYDKCATADRLARANCNAAWRSATGCSTPAEAAEKGAK